MGNRKDDIRTFVVIVVVCAICIVIALILNIKSNVDELSSVNEYNVFFSNVNYINSYINYVASENSIAIYNVLDKKYIEKNNITYDNILDYIDDYSIGSSLKATGMEYVKVGNNFVYYVKGMIYENTYEGVSLLDDDFSIVVVTDFKNLSFSLYPVDNNNYKEVINGIKKINIVNNTYNTIVKSELINKERICGLYLSDFINNLSDSYALLSDDMKEIYIDKDMYNSYIKDNISSFSSVADKCRMDEIDDIRVYTVIDKNSNTYVFTEESIMKYKVDFYICLLKTFG